MINGLLELILVMSYTAWILSSATTEAILYSGQGSKAFKWNEHVVYTINRLSTLMMVVSATLLHDKLLTINGVVMLISLVSIYPFFHDGQYYETRKQIDTPSYNFKSSSQTSTAWIELNWPKRLTLFIIGVILPITYKLSIIYIK